ncbi:sensor histidine kinase [Paenibacillus sp. GSMTC-2017]|uniref:sensor histidine kinase n=1 Tax=Paenibacillus sp. GSMTC-2017 TaxID=2794350 RepID=UPI0018D6EFA4|nr:sensor histidine kinase [Paenibacillus sp. GSMTC-2017]MBH5319217.1 sensor histidine kinase [Paenibacillus sp. GSMTC-2017]
MSRSELGISIVLFIKDRLLYMLSIVVIIGLGCSVYFLEQKRYPGLIESGTIIYFVILALSVLGVWLVLDYVRQRYYFKQVIEALRRSDELNSATIVHSIVTEEQKLVSSLLQEQHRAYLNELNKYRRQQELHNHFVLQWVHHMKTPVSVVDLLMQEAVHQQPTTEHVVKSLIDSVQEETERMTRGLDMMLYTARLDKFELDLHVRRIALHEKIRGAINENKRLCIKNAIFPRIEGEAWMETDEKWILFVINQLIGNAIKYSKGKQGSKLLLIRLTTQGEGIGKLEVIDQGIGIASHDLSRIFDPFFTGENGRTTGESTGMGLYLAKQVCSRLGHRLTVSSELGTGTTFTIHFEPSGIHVMD